MFSSYPDKARGFGAWGLAATILIVLAVNLPNATAFFSQDDFAGLNVRASNLHEFTQFFAPDTQGLRGWYRPLSFDIKFWLMHMAFGFNPLPYHLLPLLIHCLNILLCYRFLHKLTNRIDLPLAASALYGLCGAHQIALYWVSAGVEPITAFFYLLGLNTFLSWRNRPTLFRTAGIVVLFILMLLCKESAVTFPIVLVFTDIIFPDTSTPRGRATPGKKIVLYTWLFAILIAYLLFWFLKQYHPGVGEEHGYGPTLNPLRIIANFFAYLIQVFTGNAILYAIFQKYSPGEPREFATSLLTSPVGIIFALVCIAAFVLIVLWIRRRWSGFYPHERRAVGWGFAWFIICLVPVLPIPGHNTAYYLNIPLIGFSGCLAGLVLGLGHTLPSRIGWRLAGWLLLILYAGNFVANTYLGAHITPLAKRSIAGKHAFEQMVSMHPSFEPGTLLFIIDIDEETRWTLNDGLIFKAYYGDQLRWCFTIKTGQDVEWGYLVVHGWDEGGPKIFYGYDGVRFTPIDENYFRTEYALGAG